MMHILFGITLVLYLLKLSAGKGYISLHSQKEIRLPNKLEEKRGLNSVNVKRLFLY